MKKNEVKIGGKYYAKVGSAMTTVRIDDIKESYTSTGAMTRYYVTNLRTGRKTVFRSAAKFRSEVKPLQVTPSPNEDERAEDEQSADPTDQVEQTTASTVSGGEPTASSGKVIKLGKTWDDSEGEQCSDPTSAPSVADLQVTATASKSSEVGDEKTRNPFADPNFKWPQSGFLEDLFEEATCEVIPTKSTGTPDSASATTVEKSAEITQSRQSSSGSGLLTSQLSEMARSAVSSSRRIAGYIPTDEQGPIIDIAQTLGAGDQLIISAGAGAGKTSTLRMLEEVLYGRGQYTAFNKSLVDESRVKFKKARCSTTHSLAFNVTGKMFSSRLNGGRIKSDEIARILGIQEQEIETPWTDGGRKRLSAAFLAGQVIMAVKKFCQSADREVKKEHFKYIDGIDESIGGKRQYKNNDMMKRYLLDFARKAWDDLSQPTGRLPFHHDIYVKCQPGGTKVFKQIAGDVGKWIPIEAVRVGQKLFGMPEHSKGSFPVVTVTRTGQRHYDGELVCVDTGSCKSEYTPDHICMVRISDTLPGKVVVYLMKKGNNFRVGRVRWRYGSQSDTLGITTRAYDQDPDALWVLSDHPTDTDAALAEAITQYRFGIPGWQFSSRNETMPLEQFWKEVGDITERATRCLEAFGRDIRYPLLERNWGRKWNRAVVEIRACNLMNGMRFFESSGLRGNSRRDEVWKQARVTRRKFSGTVYSLETSGSHTYIADGIGTHNCWQLGDGVQAPFISAEYILLDEAQDTAPVLLDILRRQRHALLVFVGDSNQQIYDWRGAVDAMKAFPDAPRKLLTQSFRFGQIVADVANSILAGLSEPTDLIMRGLPSIPSITDKIDRPRCVLCRTNARAVATLLQGVAEERKPCLIGGGSDVIAFVKGARDLKAGRATSHPDLACFSSWHEVEMYSKEDEGEDLRLMVKLIKEFGCEGIIAALETQPEEKYADLVISTAHKSKGREWDTVKLAEDFPPATKMTDSDRRLLYVAATRAKLGLDISVCPSFHDYVNDETGESSPGIKVEYTIEMPPKEEYERALTEMRSPESAHASTVDSAQAQQDRSRIQNADVGADGSTKPIATGFTWVKHDGNWVVKGPFGNANQRVQVTRRNGSTSIENLGGVISSPDENTCLYAIARR